MTRKSLTKQEKAQIMDDFKNFILDVKNKDVNCYLLRFTSLWMDGSYTDYEQYQLNIRKYNRCASEKTRLAFCYQCLTYMIKIEFGSFFSQTLIEEMLKNNLSTEELNWFNTELLERAYETLSNDVM